ncbi:MAG: glycosyltransferase family 4 protein, partial [Nitrospirae bacterium]|nr:glycosyltransferase family 4 protein [Nitrospirota bacterium]
INPQQAIERFYAAADAFVLPTLYDPFSNAAIEAMSSGIPVITTKNNGASELIGNGEEGVIIDNPLDAEELADGVKFVLKDADYMGARARKKAEQFPIESAAAQFITAIKELNKC